VNNPVNFSPNGGKFSASFSSFLAGIPGPNGLTPHIGENGNWWIGEEDTGVKAQGEDGVSPKLQATQTANGDILIEVDYGDGFNELATIPKGEEGFTPEIYASSYLDPDERYCYEVFATKSDGTRTFIGGFKDGKDGKDYVLTDGDKKEIADIARADLESVLGDIDTALDSIIARQASVIGGVE
jgi:hypothetical protein